MLHIQQSIEVESKKKFQKLFLSRILLPFDPLASTTYLGQTALKHCSKSEVILQVRQFEMTVTEVNPNMSVRPKCPYCRDIFALQAAQPPRRPRS